MNGVARSRGVGVYVANEVSNVLWGRGSQIRRKAVLSLQGSHGTSDTMLSLADTFDRCASLALDGFTVASGDLSQTASQGTYGNDTGRTRVGQLLSFVQSNSSPIPCTGPVHLLGVSGGATAAIQYARANPANVASMYLITPLVDLADFYANRTDATLTQSEVNKAYNNGVDDGGTAFNAALPTHDPSAPGNQAALAGIPIRLAYSDNDQYCPASTVTAYAELVNAAGGSATAYSEGAVAHQGTGVDTNDVLAFFRTH